MLGIGLLYHKFHNESGNQWTTVNFKIYIHKEMGDMSLSIESHMCKIHKNTLRHINWVSTIFFYRFSNHLTHIYNVDTGYKPTCITNYSF